MKPARPCFRDKIVDSISPRVDLALWFRIRRTTLWPGQGVLRPLIDAVKEVLQPSP